MVVDSSSVVAILMKEEGFESLVERMAGASTRFLSAASYVEACMVLVRKRGDNARVELDWFLTQSDITLVPFDKAQAVVACRGFLLYGKGRSPARLNLGDCYSYALAKVLGMPLLYVGNDFAQTDVSPAWTFHRGV